MTRIAHWGAVNDPPHGLVAIGPLVNVRLVAHPKHRASVPDVGPVRLMIDTGAQRTLVDDALCVKLGLPPIRFDEIVGVSGKPESWPVYLLGVRLGLSSHPKAQENAFAVFGAEVIGMPVGPHDQHRGLLGRDFLANFELGYDGPNGSFAIMVPATRAAALAGPTATPNRAERRRLARQKTGP